MLGDACTKAKKRDTLTQGVGAGPHSCLPWRSLLLQRRRAPVRGSKRLSMCCRASTRISTSAASPRRCRVLALRRKQVAASWVSHRFFKPCRREILTLFCLPSTTDLQRAAGVNWYKGTRCVSSNSEKCGRAIDGECILVIERPRISITDLLISPLKFRATHIRVSGTDSEHL